MLKGQQLLAFLTFMSGKNSILGLSELKTSQISWLSILNFNWNEHEKSSITSGPGCWTLNSEFTHSPFTVWTGNYMYSEKVPLSWNFVTVIWWIFYQLKVLISNIVFIPPCSLFCFIFINFGYSLVTMTKFLKPKKQFTWICFMLRKQLSITNWKCPFFIKY